MKIVVICGSYMPNYSAVGICAKNVVNEFVKLGHDVTVVAERTTIPITENHIEEIRHISSSYLDLYLSPNSFFRLLYRVIGYLRAILSSKNIKYDIVKAYLKELENISRNGKIDLIIPLCFPFESILAANKFAEIHRTEVMPVIFDNLVMNNKYNRLKLNRILKEQVHLRLLKEVITKSKKVFVIHSQKTFFEQKLNKEMHKVIFIEHPLLLRPERILRTSTTVFYAGSFLKGYVPSKDMAKILEKVVPVVQNHFEFCVMGDDLKSIKALAAKFPDKIRNNGTIPFKRVMEKIADVGFFISVAEIKGVQISSKIFTYISTGKPIIHFYYANNDINLHILKKYPLLCPINLKDSDKDKLVNKLISFLNIKHKIIDFDEIQTLFPDALPKFLVNNIISALDD